MGGDGGGRCVTTEEGQRDATLLALETEEGTVRLERLEEARGTGGKSRKEHGPAGAVTLATETCAGLRTHRTVRCVFQATAGGNLHSSSRKIMQPGTALSSKL